MKILRPTDAKPIHGPTQEIPPQSDRATEKKPRPPKLTVELSDAEVEMLAIYIAEHRTTLRQTIRWLIKQLPHLPGGPPLRSQSRPERADRKSRGEAI